MLITASQVAAVRDIFAMGIVVDTEQSQVLLEIPNALGWRYHYGCRVIGGNDDNDDYDPKAVLLQQFFAAAAENNPNAKGDDNKNYLKFKSSGRMYFEFENCHDIDPMLVHVFVANNRPKKLHEQEASADDIGDAVGGKWYDFTSVPYENMWADDPLWMPDLLNRQKVQLNENDESYFEGVFIFDGPPGTGTLLKDHTVRVYDANNKPTIDN